MGSCKLLFELATAVWDIKSTADLLLEPSTTLSDLAAFVLEVTMFGLHQHHHWLIARLGGKTFAFVSA